MWTQSEVDFSSALHKILVVDSDNWDVQTAKQICSQFFEVDKALNRKDAIRCIINGQKKLPYVIYKFLIVNFMNVQKQPCIFTEINQKLKESNVFVAFKSIVYVADIAKMAETMLWKSK